MKRGKVRGLCSKWGDRGVEGVCFLSQENGGVSSRYGRRKLGSVTWSRST